MIIHFRTTKKCNMNCIGCSSPDNKEENFKNDETNLKKLNSFLKFYKILTKSTIKEIDIRYVGGEVLYTEDIHYFQKIEKNLKQNFKISSGIQTNLIINKEKLKSLNKFYPNKYATSYNFSNDRLLNNSNHKFKKIFKENYNYLSNLSNNKVPIIVLITNKNVKYMYRIYQFCNKNNIDVTFRHFLPLGEGKNLNHLIPDNEIFSKNIIKIFKDEKRKISVMPLDTMIKLVKGEISNSCGFQKNCHECSLSIENDNKVYTCLEMAEIKKYSISDNLKTINKKNYEIIKNRETNLPNDCNNCEFLKYCHGGCMVEGYLNEGDIYGKTYMCNSWKKIFGTLLKH